MFSTETLAYCIFNILPWRLRKTAEWSTFWARSAVNVTFDCLHTKKTLSQCLELHCWNACLALGKYLKKVGVLDHENTFEDTILCWLTGKEITIYLVPQSQNNYNQYFYNYSVSMTMWKWCDNVKGVACIENLNLQLPSALLYSKCLAVWLQLYCFRFAVIALTVKKL